MLLNRLYRYIGRIRGEQAKRIGATLIFSNILRFSVRFSRLHPKGPPKGRYLGEGVAPVCKVAARRFRSMLHTCFRAQLSAKIRRRKGIFASIIYVKIMQHLRSDTWALVQFEQPHQLVEAGKLQQPTRATGRAGKPQQLVHQPRLCHTSLDSHRREG